MESDKVTFRGAVVQIISSVSIGCLAFQCGLLFTWPSYNVANFVSNSTVLSEPMSLIHVSLLGGLLNVGIIFLTPLVGFMMNKIGRKYTIMSVAFLFLITWTIVLVTKSVSWILVAMTIGGCGATGQAITAIYISEIAQDSIRGALSSFAATLYFLGIMVSYFIGGYLTYLQVAYVQLAVAVINITMLSMLKDAPIYLLTIGKEKEAAESIAFYSQKSTDSKHVANKIIQLKMQLDPRLDIMFQGEDPMVTKKLLPVPEPPKLSDWQFLKQSPSSIRAIITSFMIMTNMMLMGNGPIQTYAETLFTESVPSYDPNTCSVWLGVVFIIGSIVCVLVVDRLGRKILTIFSCASSSVCTLILGTLIQFKWAPEWFIIFMIYLYNFFFNIGIAVIPFVLIGEIFLPEVRCLAGSLTISIGYALNFILTLIFNPILENYGFAPLFYGFTVVGFAGTAYTHFYLPETKGLSTDDIDALFLKKCKKKLDAQTIKN